MKSTKDLNLIARLPSLERFLNISITCFMVLAFWANWGCSKDYTSEEALAQKELSEQAGGAGSVGADIFSNPNLSLEEAGFLSEAMVKSANYTLEEIVLMGASPVAKTSLSTFLGESKDSGIRQNAQSLMNLWDVINPNELTQKDLENDQQVLREGQSAKRFLKPINSEQKIRSKPQLMTEKKAGMAKPNMNPKPGMDMPKPEHFSNLIFEKPRSYSIVLPVDPLLFHGNRENNSKQNADSPIHKGNSVELDSPHSNTKETKNSTSFDRRAFYFKDPTEIILDPGREMIAKGKEGTTYRFPRHAFEFEDGRICKDPVSIKIREYYALDDILLGGLTTNSPNGLLQTGGMVHAVAQSKGEAVRLRTNVKSSLSFSPIIENASDYGLYDGKVKGDQITWEKSNVDQDTSDPQRIRVSAQPLPEAGDTFSSLAMTKSISSWSGRNRSGQMPLTKRMRTKPFPLEIPRGFVKFLDRKNDMPKYVDISTRYGPQTIKGLGEIAFPNGIRLFFHGELEIRRFTASSSPNFHRFEEGGTEETPSELEVTFEGAFLAGKIPSAHPHSLLKIFIRNDEQRNKQFPEFITYHPQGIASLFLVNPESLHRHDHSNFVNWKHILNGNKNARFVGMANYSVCLQDQNGRTHALALNQLNPFSRYRAKLAHNYGSFGAHELVNLQGEIGLPGNRFKPTKTDHEFWDRILQLDELREKTTLIESSLRLSVPPSGMPFRANPFPLTTGLQGRSSSMRFKGLLTMEEGQHIELLRTGILPKIESLAPEKHNVDLSEAKDVIDNLLSKNKELKRIHEEFMERLTREENQEIRKKSFLTTFGINRLGWHNLDRLIHRRPLRSFDLIDQSSSINIDENSTELIDPSYYAVWPEEGISTRTKKGRNMIPRGNFMAFGFKVTETGEILADFKPSQTGEEVRLHFEKMTRSEFEEQVRGFQ